MSTTSNRSDANEKRKRFVKESARKLAKEKQASPSEGSDDAPLARKRGFGSSAKRPQPTIRLTAVSTMTEMDQQRLQLLLDQLIERRMAQLPKGEEL